jgi:hypothetical protein
MPTPSPLPSPPCRSYDPACTLPTINGVCSVGEAHYTKVAPVTPVTMVAVPSDWVYEEVGTSSWSLYNLAWTQPGSGECAMEVSSHSPIHLSSQGLCLEQLRWLWAGECTAQGGVEQLLGISNRLQAGRGSCG